MDCFLFERIITIADRISYRDKELSLSSIPSDVWMHIPGESEITSKAFRKFVMEEVMIKEKIFESDEISEFENIKIVIDWSIVFLSYLYLAKLLVSSCKKD